MSIIKYCDLFDIKFHFNTENQPKNRSTFGGIMSLIFLGIIFYFIYVSEYKEICKGNPISSKSEITFQSDTKNTNIKSEKIWIPWRFVGDEEQFIDHRNFLYPEIYYVKGERNNNAEDDLHLKYTKLNYKLCNETSMINLTKNYMINMNLSELFCIDDEKAMIGGSWLSNQIEFIEIKIYLCESGINFNESDSKCNEFPDLLPYENTKMFFEIFYPIVQFQPTNIKEPIVIVYKNHYHGLSNQTKKEERIYLKENILSDDQNIVLNKPKNYSYWGLDNFAGDVYYLSQKSKSDFLYSFQIYKDNGLIYYKRSYKKIITIISDIFPIVNIIFFFFKKIIKTIKSSYIRKNLTELLFVNASLSPKKPVISFHNKNYPLQSQRNFINNDNRQSSHYSRMSPIKHNDKILSLHSEGVKEGISSNNNVKISLIDNSCNRISPSLNFVNLNNVINDKKNSLMNIRNKKMSNNGLIKNLPLIKESKKIKKLFPIYYYFMDFFSDTLFNPNKYWFVSKKYLIVYKFMNQLYDISSFILLYEKYNILRAYVFFKKNLGNNAKINVNNADIMNTIKKELEEKNSAVFSGKILFDD